MIGSESISHMMRMRTGMTVMIAWLIVGCQPVDRWTVFEPESDAKSTATPNPPELAERLARDEEPLSSSSPVTIAGEGPIELTVEDATLWAIQNNRDLQVQRLNPAITATFEDIERGVYDPELFAGAEFFEEEGVEISRATEENFAAIRNDELYDAGIRQQLPTGTDLELSTSLSRSTSNRAPEQQVLRGGLTVTQALLRGFGPAVNLASVRQAELETDASFYQLQGFVEALVAETETTYWQYALATERIRIFEQSLELARRQRRETAQRIEIGVLAQTQSASAEAEVAQRQQDLIDARARMQTLRHQLLRLINPMSDGHLDREINVQSEPAMDAEPIDNVFERIELAVQQRPDLNEARLRLEQRRLETIVTRNGVLPRLDLFITLGKTGFADAFSQAYRNIDGPTFDFTAGVDFSFPIGNRAAEARDLQARTSRRQAAKSVSNLQQLVRLDVHTAATEVERARQQIEASAATRALREEALRAEEERFRVGESTSLLVAQAQRDLLESQIAEVEAIVGYRVALIDLYLAEGTLLSRRGLTMNDQRLQK